MAKQPSAGTDPNSGDLIVRSIYDPKIYEGQIIDIEKLRAPSRLCALVAKNLGDQFTEMGVITASKNYFDGCETKPNTDPLAPIVAVQLFLFYICRSNSKHVDL